MKRWLLVIGLTWTGVGCLALENRLLYHPSPSREEGELPPPLQDFLLKTADGTKIHARWCPHPSSQGAIILCHGNAGNLSDRGKQVRTLSESLHESILIFDYPGYGKSGGKPSEAGCYASAEAAYRFLTDELQISPDKILIYGESLGGGVATELASKHPYRALILVRTFSSIPDVAQAQFTWSARPFVQTRFDSVARLKDCKKPLFLAMADQDRLIPYAHADKLRTASAGPVEFERLGGLDHIDPLPNYFYSHLREFLTTKASP